MNYDAMPAGREMDQLVAKRVMEWREVGGGIGVPPDPQATVHVWVPDYSVNLSWAWGIVRAMNQKGIHLWALSQEDPEEEGCHWKADFGPAYSSAILGCAETAPLALCRAALAAIDVYHPIGVFDWMPKD